MLLARKMIVGKTTARPFSLSGSWENDSNDGWSQTSGFSTDNFMARTGLQSKRFFGGTNSEYQLVSENIKGLLITVSFWIARRSSGNSGLATILASINGGSFNQIGAQSWGASSNWTLVSAQIPAPDGGNIVIRIANNTQNAHVDDWSITGVRP